MGGDAPAPSDPETPEQAKKRREAELEKMREALPAESRPALELLDQFRDREFRAWSSLRDRIAAHGAAAVPALRIHLKELDWEVRAFAASCAGATGDRAVAADVAEALAGETYTEARRRMVIALSDLGAKTSADALVTAAADKDPGVRLAAVRGLGLLADPAQAAEIRKWVDDPEPDVRYEARGALAALGDEKAVAALLAEAVALVEDRDAQRKNSEPREDNTVRYAQYLLGLALSRARTKVADKVLVDAVLAEKPWDNKDFFRMGAAEGLATRSGRSGEPIHPALLAGVSHRDDRVRVACSYAAGFAHSADMLPRLRAALQDSQMDVRHNAVVALGRMGTPEAAKALKLALADRAGEVRIGAVRSLADIAGPESTEALLQAIRDSRYMIRVQAARAVADRTAGEGVIDALVRLAKDPDYGARAQAMASLAHAAASPAVLDAAAAGLGDEDHGVRAAACLCLGTLADRAAVGAREDAIRRVVALCLGPDEARVMKAALECLDAVRAPACVPPLLDALGNASEQVRERANTALKKVSETSRNFDPKGSDSDRAAAEKRWREWWADQGGKLRPRGAKSRIAVTGDLVDVARDLKWRGLDICLLFDSTASMAALISAAKERIDEIIRQLGLLLPSLRVSVYTYRDETDDYIYYGTPLTFDTWKLTGFLQTAVHGQGRDIPEAVYPAVKNATKSLLWRPESHKVVVYAGDAPHHPDVEQVFLRDIKDWFTKDNRAVLHALFTDTNRRSLDVKARTKRTDMSNVRIPFFEKYKLTAEAGRGRAVLLDDESALIKEMLVLTFGEAWRVDIENLLDFEI